MNEKPLERCPCCGDASDYDTDEEIDGWFIFCMNRSCGCRSGIFQNKPMARNAWNTRVSSPAQEPVTTEPVAQLREIVGAVLFANWSGEEDEPGTTPWKDWTDNLPMNSVGLGKTHFLETADQLLASLPSEVLAIPAPPTRESK